MAANRIKPLSQSISVTTANTVSNGTNIIVTTTAQTLITVAYANTTVKGSVVLPASFLGSIKKDPTDTITANVAVFATVGTAG